MQTLHRKQYVYFACALFLASFLPAAAPGCAADWPADVTPAQKAQIIRQEIATLKALVLNSKSAKKNSAAAYLAVNLSDNSVLLQKNPGKQYSIASVTKLMNALVVSENIGSGKTITLNEKMLLPYGASPALFSGLAISASDLLRASLTQSVNDASESLSYFFGREKFLVLMNKKARQLGMAHTFFADAHGLSPLNRSTAADLAKLLSYIDKKHPQILAATRDNDFWLPDSAGKPVKFQNLNDFYAYPGFIGGKTGYLPAAGQSFAGLFEIDKKRIAIVLLHSANYEADTFKIISQIKK